MTSPQTLRRLSKDEMRQVDTAVARLVALISRAKALKAEKRRRKKMSARYMNENGSMVQRDNGCWMLVTDHAAEVERLTAENKKYVDDLVNRGTYMINVLTVERDAAVAAKERAVEALRFYANKMNWRDGNTMFNSSVHKDVGTVARAALSLEPCGGPEPSKGGESATIEPNEDTE